MSQLQPLISIVIVNYNVKEYLEQALLSIQRALRTIDHEIIIVDNASVDGSVAHIRQRFPDVQLIASSENLGFGRANNLALQQASGRFIVLINPDTVVQEDTFQKLLEFFQQTPDAGAATCKIINPDGSFSVDCRHSIPTPMIAFWKVTGLSKLFPKSKTFARYNLTYLDEDKTYPVPGISGCFMMIREEVLEKTGHFDERFFMYCEDIDLCHRINQSGSKIYYVPTSQIIHYKGESTKKNNIDYVVTFNRALYQFFEKYYAQSSVFLFRWMILLAIILRGVFIYLRNFFHEHFPQVLDVVLLNAVLLASFVVRFEAKDGFLWQNFIDQYWIINLISTLIFLIGAYYLDVYPRHRFSIQGIIKSNLLTFLSLAAITFFLKQFAFSRMVVLIAAMVSPLVMIGWRALLKRSFLGDQAAWGKDIYSKVTIVVGSPEGALALHRKLSELHDLRYDLRGVVYATASEHDLQADPQIPLLGRLANLPDLIRMHRARQIIFSSENLSYERILQAMSQIAIPSLEYKIAPSNLEFVIGKSSVERLDDYPLVDIDYAIGRPFNRMSKRAFDLLISALLLVFLSLPALPLLWWRRKSIRRDDIFSATGQPLALRYYHVPGGRHLINLYLQWWQVFKGGLSFVGAPIAFWRAEPDQEGYFYKPGITGLAQLNAIDSNPAASGEKYHLFYLKNQSIWLDLEIIARSILRRKSGNRAR